MNGYIFIIILTAIPSGFLNKLPKRTIYKRAQSSTAVDLRTEPCATFFASVARQNPANSERRNALNVGVAYKTKINRNKRGALWR